MRPLLFRIASVFFSVLLAAAPAHAQQDPDQLGDVLNNIGQDYADNYTQPITDALGAGMNSGLFRTAEVGGGGILPMVDIYVGVSAMGTFTSGSADTFEPQDDDITVDGRTFMIDYRPSQAPTAFGEEESPGRAVISDDDPRTPDQSITLPPGLLLLSGDRH